MSWFRHRDSTADSEAIGATGVVAALHAVEMVSEVAREAALITKLAHQQAVVQIRHVNRHMLTARTLFLLPIYAMEQFWALQCRLWRFWLWSSKSSMHRSEWVTLRLLALVLQLTVGNAKVLLVVHGQIMDLILLVVPHAEVVVPKLEPDLVAK